MKKIILFMAAILITGACQELNENHGLRGNDLNVGAAAQIIGDTVEGYVWSESDVIGVHVQGMADYLSETNIAFRYDNVQKGFVPQDAGIVLKGAERVLNAYHPYVGKENEKPAVQAVDTRSKSQTVSGWQKMDWMFAQTTATREEPVADFEFHHTMGQIRLDFKTEDGSTGKIRYTVSGLLHDGTFDPYTGELKVTTTKSDDITMETGKMSGALLLLPQTSEVSISLLYEEKTYTGVFTADVTADECRRYTVTISEESLDKTLLIKDSGIADWIEGKVEHMHGVDPDGDTEGWKEGEGDQLGNIAPDTGSEDWTEGEGGMTGNLLVKVSDSGRQNGSIATRTYTDGDFKTHFENGDKIGVFGIKDGKVLPNMNNRCLTFNGSGWKFDANINYGTAMEGAVFHAYMPYKEGMEINVSSTDPLEEIVKGWEVASDQSTKASFIASDLMTASTELILIDGKFTLDFAMEHRMGMLVIELPVTTYEFTNTDIRLDNYVVGMPQDVRFTVYETGEELIPVIDQESQTRRLIVKPDSPQTIFCTYTSNQVPNESLYEISDGVAAGTYETYIEGSGIEKIGWELKLGDYYCADGRIAHYDASVPAPANAIGVVYAVGAPESITKERPEFTHGLVYAMERVKRQPVEGDPGKYSTLFEGDDYVSVFGIGKEVVPDSVPEEEKKDWKWYEHDEYYEAGATKFTKNDHNATDLNGYGYTRSWLAYKGTAGINSLFIAGLNKYRESVILPGGLTTEWYLASYDEFHSLLAQNAEILNQSLTHAAKETVFEGTAEDQTGSNKNYKGYWTSSLRATASVVNYYSLGDEDNGTDTIDIKQAGDVTSRYGFFRFSFAF